MHRLTHYRGVSLLLLLFCTTSTIAQLVPVDLQDDSDSARLQHRLQQEFGQGETESLLGTKQQQREQRERVQRENELLSIVATTYLQPRPTALSAVNPTRFNSDKLDSEDEEEQDSDGATKLLPAVPVHQRKRKRDQAANIFRTLAHLTLLRPLLSIPYHLLLLLSSLLRTLYTYSLPPLSILLSPLHLIITPFRLAYHLFQAFQPLFTFALIALGVGASMGVAAAALGGSGVVPSNWGWGIGGGGRGQKLGGGRTAEELMVRDEQEARGKEARWERREPRSSKAPRRARTRAGMDDTEYHTTTPTPGPASTSTRSRSTGGGSGAFSRGSASAAAAAAAGEEGKVQQWRRGR